jgi:Winged helix DNA-binding domain
MPVASKTARVRRTAGDTLDARALNRALLARQLLLRRARRTPADAVEHLVGMQAQIPANPYVALWSRLQRFDPAALACLLTERRAVRIVLMRATIHLVSARDCLELRRLVQPAIDRQTQGAFGRRLEGVDRAALAGAGRLLVEHTPRTFAALGALLAEHWPASDAEALANAVRALVPLVQVPPRGVWGASGQATHTSAEQWLGAPLSAAPSVDALVLRYLGAFGPATVRDAQAWAGITRLGAAFERLRPRLRTFRDDAGRELFDLPDAPRPPADTPAPPRFLPEYDNVFLGHADRRRIGDDAARRFVGAPNGYQAPFLLDGFIAGRWRVQRARGTATLVLCPVRRLASADRQALGEEGEGLLALLAPGAEHDVRFERQ